MNFNDYRKVTSQGFQELLSLYNSNKTDGIKADLQHLEDKLFAALEDQTSRIKTLAQLMSEGGHSYNPPGDSAAIYTGASMVKVLALESEISNLSLKVDNIDAKYF